MVSNGVISQWMESFMMMALRGLDLSYFLRRMFPATSGEDAIRPEDVMSGAVAYREIRGAAAA